MSERVTAEDRVWRTRDWSHKERSADEFYARVKEEIESAERAAREEGAAEEAEAIAKEALRRADARGHVSPIAAWIRARHAKRSGVNDPAWKESIYHEAKAGLKHVGSAAPTFRIVGKGPDGTEFAMVPEARVREIIDEVLAARFEQSKRLVREIVREEIRGAVLTIEGLKLK